MWREARLICQIFQQIIDCSRDYDETDVDMTVGSKKVLFVCTHGIGDFIMTIPTIRLAAANGFDVLLLLKGSLECDVADTLLGDVRFIRKSLSDCGSSRWRQALWAIQWIRKQKIGYAFAQYGVSAPLFSLLTAVGRVRFRAGWHGTLSFFNSSTLFPTGAHKVVETARFLRFLGIEYARDDLLFFHSDVDDSHQVDRVAFAPGVGEIASHRAWPTERYVDLAKRLVEAYGVRIELLGGLADKDLCQFIADKAGLKDSWNLAGKLSIRESIERLRKTGVVVASCNGVSHMAAAVGTEVVGLYGPTDAAHTGPFTNRTTDISRQLTCSPCYRRGYETGCGDPVCMTGISVETVYEAVSRLIEKKRMGIECDVKNRSHQETT